MHEHLLRSEILSAERLEQLAENIALEHGRIVSGAQGKKLTKRLQNNSRHLHESYHALSDAMRGSIELPPAAEWLVDNYFVIEEQIREIQNDLPPSYYRKLPKLLNGPLKGYPRIYAIATSFVAHTDSFFNIQLLAKFIDAYQRRQPLNICELWAVSIALRFAFVENLRRASLLVVGHRKARAEADEFATRLLKLVENDPKGMEKGLKSIDKARLSPSFTVQLIRRLRDQDTRALPFLQRLDERLKEQGEVAENIVRLEHQNQGALTVTVRNIITSMRLISTFDWVEFFETTSLVDDTLRSESAFAEMDLPTRNLYRRAVEQLAERSNVTEHNVAHRVLHLCMATRQAMHPDNNQRDQRKCDPGYYLVDKGRPILEAAIGYRPAFGDRIRRVSSTANFVAYVLANILLVTCIIYAGLAGAIHHNKSFGVLLLLSAAAFFPAWEAAITLVNRFVFMIRAPSILPGMAFREGLPSEFRTMVVVPVLLGSDHEAKNQVEQIQVNYLSNADEDLRFVLLSDFRDADQENLPQDDKILESARTHIALLNQRYPMADGTPRFYLLHRRRQWNGSEGKWMGWERKRGKLQEFNRLLRGARNTSFLMEGGYEQLQLPANVRFIITLDADTRLPRGSVKRLVGKMAHPLNRGYFDPAVGYVVEGYGVLQPRVSSSLPEQHSNTLFQRIFYSASGLDPYAFSVSDVYQDLFDEGSFTGKGIYDVDVFEEAVSGRIPDNTVLSHDLIEGIYARAGLASDVEVIEEFPSRYDVASMRQHRWARGDWQLLPWIFGRRSHEIPALGYWKMVDNLRRTFTAPFTLLALIVGWMLPSTAAGVWTFLVLAAFTMPLLLSAFESLLPRSGVSRSSHMYTLLLDLQRATQQILSVIAFLPHQAWQMLDAIVRTLWRLGVSRRNLLEWVTAAQTKARGRKTLFGFYQYMWGGIALVVFAAFVLVFAMSASWELVAPFFILWLGAPAFAYISSCRVVGPQLAKLEVPDRKQFRLIGRQTWRFFETFVTAKENGLPPDNFQEDPFPVIAHRTSPTNIGLHLLATASAHDLGWIGMSETLERIENCFTTLAKMERHRGHFFNWYDTLDLRPLEPRYISSVDSGNLAGSFLVIAEVCQTAAAWSIINSNWSEGADDVLVLIQDALARTSTQSTSRHYLEDQLSKMNEELGRVRILPFTLKATYDVLVALRASAASIVDLSSTIIAERESNADQTDKDIKQWGIQLHASLQNNLDTINRCAPWVEFTEQNSLSLPVELSRLLMGSMPKLQNVPELCVAATEMLESSNEIYKQQLLSLLQAGEQNTRTILETSERLSEQASRFFNDMEFGFLLDPRRKLLSIGYRVADNALDPSCYDLLASEARLASIVAIAKGDIPESNWFRLGRAVTSVDHRPALVSWSGSMFEYLMPALIMREPDDSLLGVSNHMIVRRQISYGNERGIPWGVSESAYNARDFELTYQYSSFGIPGLGLKRGLSENIVIAPYATGLAAMVEPKAALNNYARMATMGARGYYGWYEAIDFTHKRLPEDKKEAVVKTYMAHHQGMSIVAIQNVLLDGLMRDRFHAHPLIKATELLLQELPPRNVALSHPRSEEVEAIAHIREIKPTQPRCFKSPHGPVPRTHLLSNGQYAVMMTTAGSGYSRWRDISVTRWREDPTRDNWGSYIYVRDVNNGNVWSTTYQPTCVEPQTYEAIFHEDRAEFVRSDNDIFITQNVLISGEDQGEVRRLTISNRGEEIRELELTSYSELVLVNAPADIAHPAFSKMFIETEFMSKTGALLATRRKRSPEDHSIWAVHLISIGGENIGDLQYETDRTRFIGRGRSTRDPVAMDGRALSGTVGTVLDPIFSLRCRLRLLPGSKTHVAFWTLTGTSREEVLNLVDKYRAPSAYNRASTLAWTQAQLQYQHLGITPEEAQLFQQLANAVLYTDATMRANSGTLKAGAAAQSVLWSTGVSGDLPIVLMRVDVVNDLKTLRQLVKAHAYWSMKTLEVDLIILNDQPTTYLEDLQNEIELLVRTSQVLPGAYGKSAKGRVHVLRGDQLGDAARTLLHAAARAVIVGHRGSLAEQLNLRITEDAAPAFIARARTQIPKSSAQPVKPPVLEFFNGIGGFANNGREYVVVLEKGQNTPLPWINVIANPYFGFHVSAEGSGYTWAMNSRENKLTPWSNDPISDEPGEAIYIKDVERGTLWTPTALPIRKAEATYIARHGIGFSSFETTIHDIHTELTQYVPLEDPIKISRLKIHNTSFLPRLLSVTSFNDWVLGTFRSSAGDLVITEMDERTKAMFVSNRWTNTFGNRTAFVHLSADNIDWTGDRREFIGRNGSLANPVALAQRKTLSGKTGAGLDPCSVLQTTFELKAGQQIEIVILLGETTDAETARALIEKYRSNELDKSFNEIRNYWDKKLGQIQVETPDRSMDIMLNGWLLYQTIVCRVWARSAFYQSSGAYGYRDQLQDVMTLAVCQPQATRQHLLRAAGRQFPEGDVQHWWLPSENDAGRGVRTRFSDDALWLPFVAAYYIKVTGDAAVLEEEVPYIVGPVLTEDQHEAFFLPERSAETATLFEHCARAIDKSLATGSHGLGLFGGGDWNDGMNRVGVNGQGESIWLTWFIITTIKDFIVHAGTRDTERAKDWQKRSEELRASLEQNGWDGEWYRRGYYDDGTPLGSASSNECRIDSIAQSWAVISGAGDPERQLWAMEAIEKYLLRYDENLAPLFTPPFNHTPMDPGYIKGYPIGIRENGGQYTHAALWTVIAFVLLKEGGKAHDIFRMLNPINHASSRAATYRYKVEPYVVAADIYANPQHIGRGGWTWYTGSAGWMYRSGIEYILGLQVEGAHLRIDPCIPESWSGFKMTYIHNSARYHIRVDNKNGRGYGIKKIEMDGIVIEENLIPLNDDGKDYDVLVVLDAK